MSRDAEAGWRQHSKRLKLFMVGVSGSTPSTAHGATQGPRMAHSSGGSMEEDACSMALSLTGWVGSDDCDEVSSPPAPAAADSDLHDGEEFSFCAPHGGVSTPMRPPHGREQHMPPASAVATYAAFSFPVLVPMAGA